MSIKYNLEINIYDIEVDEDSYSFSYTADINNGKRVIPGMYNNDYSGWSISQWEKELKDGYAVELVLEQISEQL